MKLRPHEILQLLGFNVGEEGVVINPDDAYLMHSALNLAGSTIDISRVPDDQLLSLHTGLAGIGAAWKNKPAIEANADSLDKLRSTLILVLKHNFNKVS